MNEPSLSAADLSRAMRGARAITHSLELPDLADALGQALGELFRSEVDVRLLRGDTLLASARAGEGAAVELEPFRSTRRAEVSGLGVEVLVRAPRPVSPGVAHETLEALSEVTLATAQQILWLAEARAVARERQEIVAIVSHDLRTPLQSVALGLDAISMLISGSSVAGASAPTLLRMQRSVTTMSRLLNDLLDVSRIHDGAVSVNLRVCDIGKIVAELAEQHAPLATARGFPFEVSSGAAGAIVCDQARLVQALSNLLTNAIRHATHGPIVLRVTRHEGAVRFEVIDHGPGIPREIRARLFDRLFQADEGGRRGGGLGLGLYIARGIAVAHGGRIGVESEVGRGSTFWIDVVQPSERDGGETA